MIAVFFAVLASSVCRRELRPWVNAWLANLVALSVTIVFWLAQPQSMLAFKLIAWSYIFSKTVFVTLLVMGAAEFMAQAHGRISYRKLLLGIAGFSLVGTFAAR